jgi:hypothetical protein
MGFTGVHWGSLGSTHKPTTIGIPSAIVPTEIIHCLCTVQSRSVHKQTVHTHTHKVCKIKVRTTADLELCTCREVIVHG